MNKKSFSVLGLLLIGALSQAQEIKFEEYDLPNGMHVILHQDNKAPVVTTAVMYHVGAKDEIDGKSGFAHFFEHLLFEGTENIKRGEFMKIVSSNGGSNNANTSVDRTYYYESFPSNNLQLGLWLEAERLRHPVINEIGVRTQNEVVKEEKKLRVDNQPYGNMLQAINEGLFKKHPYKNSLIGKIEDLNSAKLDEFKDFFKKYYVPNNATLVVAGDIDKGQTKKLISDYFGTIPKGTAITRNFPKEDAITKQTEMTVYDANIQLPAYAYAYRTPSNKVKDSKVLEMVSSYLSNGKSSVLYKKLVDDEKKALAVQALNLGQEDYSVFAFFAIPQGSTTEATLRADIDSEIKKMQTTLISEEDYQKLQNQFENQFVNANSNVQGIAENLATSNVLLGDTNLINKGIDIYRSITREDLREAAKKYLNSNQRVIINYLPAKK